MNWKQFIGIALGAVVGVGIAYALHRYAEYGDPDVSIVGPGEIAY